MLDQFLETSNPTPHQTGRLSDSHISHRERDDAYYGTIVQFSARWRLILCKDQILWIIQKKQSSHRGFWRSKQYLTYKDSVLEPSGRLGLLCDESIKAILETLPARANRYHYK